ncbi:hypothetical protein [Mucilaginibacter endophyticus]|uniref:hypothetical protein n=1 Tax=Mucilaginibacter endophyticus TaxID=2675003 RepID=UPI000E0D30FC|nr:hypothetical protein [Mucilaginibacter endophyticus]
MTKYLQRAWSDYEDDIDMEDVRKAIAQIQSMDGEHGAFWVGTEEEDYVLEIDKSLKMICIVNDQGIKYQAKSWKEVEDIYELLLKEDFSNLINALS